MMHQQHRQEQHQRAQRPSQSYNRLHTDAQNLLNRQLAPHTAANAQSQQRHNEGAWSSQTMDALRVSSENRSPTLSDDAVPLSASSSAEFMSLKTRPASYAPPSNRYFAAPPVRTGSFTASDTHSQMGSGVASTSKQTPTLARPQLDMRSLGNNADTDGNLTGQNGIRSISPASGSSSTHIWAGVPQQNHATSASPRTIGLRRTRSADRNRQLHAVDEESKSHSNKHTAHSQKMGSSAAADAGPSRHHASIADSGPESPNGIYDSSKQVDRGSSGRSRAKKSQRCAKCSEPMTGQFVRALGAVFHLDCFRCQDCDKVVAAKFFPIDGPEGKQYPLCETDYFRRLSLICSKCGAALRGSYITALDMKFHVEHFTCSVCPTVFGPHDSYYEHGGKVYCHYHYSTQFAVRCTGCQTAILKQFVEINRNNIDEHWHPECYMIHKFWNIKLMPSKKHASLSPSEDLAGASKVVHAGPDSFVDLGEHGTPHTQTSPKSLRDRQKRIETQVYRIWTVLSNFEESSAACISEMLRHVSSGQYLLGIHLASHFILHVEMLFACTDQLNNDFRRLGGKEIPHIREARMLCKKVVNFFSLLSHTPDLGSQKVSITQDLLSMVTGLAHYLKILIRIALTAALRLERDFGSTSSLAYLLDRLDGLCKQLQLSKTSEPADVADAAATATSTATTFRPNTLHGYDSLATAAQNDSSSPPSMSDLCEACRLTVEEECVRFLSYRRWHLSCLSCSRCHRRGVAVKGADQISGVNAETSSKTVDFEKLYVTHLSAERLSPASAMKVAIVCSDCCGQPTDIGTRVVGVTRLEQYAFLLCVALNKLHRLLLQKGMLPAPNLLTHQAVSDVSSYMSDAHRHSTDFKRMKTVNLDRKVTNNARMAQRLVIVEGASSTVAETDSHSASGGLGQMQDGNGMAAPQQPAIFQHAYARPNFERSMTAVKISAQSDRLTNSGRDAVSHNNESYGDSEAGITLADLHSVIEAERNKQIQATPTPAANNGVLLAELSALEHLILRHAAAMLLARDFSYVPELSDLDDVLDMIDAKRNTFWGKLFRGGNNAKKERKKTGTFAVPLETLVERQGTDSILGFGRGPLRAPLFIDEALSAMKQMDMSVEGVFRKNGNIRRLNTVAEALDRDPESVNLQDENPVQVAALLKKFLRELPDPLLTFRLQGLWIATQRLQELDERKRCMHLICCLLPKCHRDVMEILCVFLKWVASFSHIDEDTGSKMDLPNLATVICPNILYSKEKDPTKDESFLAIRAVTELLVHQDDFYCVPPDLLGILADHELHTNCNDITSKDILRRAEVHLRERSQPYSGSLKQLGPHTHLREVKQTQPNWHPAFGQTYAFIDSQRNPEGATRL